MNKEVKFNTKYRLFPKLDDKNKIGQLKIDLESISYISIHDDAEKITKIVCKHLKGLNIDPKDCTITDATAGVGGNVLSFGSVFKKVNAIEIDKLRSEYLKNNIQVFEQKNVEIINEDCTKILCKLEEQNIVFIDPPWGGRSYKKHDRLKLRLSNVCLEMMVNHLMDPKITKCPPKLIVLKLPVNYHINYFYDEINSYNKESPKKIYLYNLGNMFIIVVANEIKNNVFMTRGTTSGTK